MPWQHLRSSGQAQSTASPNKNYVTSKSPVGDIPVVTLIRTDTTLDHSQKAEKVCLETSRLQLPLCDVLGAQRRIEKHIENKREREGERERERERAQS